MYIIFTINGAAPSSYIYAIADKGERPYHSYGSRILFVHGADSAAMRRKDRLPYLHDNDRYVVFKSNVPFNDFCETLQQSSYADPVNYDLYRHNCAHGAAFALNAAGIDIDFPRWQVINRVGARTNQFLPLCALTSFDVFELAKAHKIKQLQDNKIELQYELAQHALLFRARQSADKTKVQKVANLVAATNVSNAEQPEHMAMHLQVLVQAINLMLETNHEDYHRYHALSRYHRQRAAIPLPGLLLPAVSNFFQIEMLLATARAGAYLAGFAYSPKLVSVDLSGIEGAVVGVAVGIAASVAIPRLFQHVAARHRDVNANSLTRAMDALMGFASPGVDDMERLELR